MTTEDPDEPNDAESPGLSPQAALALLREGELELVGRLTEASNATFYCTVTQACPGEQPDLRAACVYKPIRGERPLNDFPRGTLAYREVAAYRVSAATGWDVVPPTLLRDGPLGPGMAQLWIEVDELVNTFELVLTADVRLRSMAVFDAVINNADRKVGHLLPIDEGHIYGVDHGVCFARQPKLRTVLWAWQGQPLDDDEIGVLRQLRAGLEGDLGDELRSLLSTGEVVATIERVKQLLSRGTLPMPDPRRPAIPWPPF
ncbi:SCO1664 family protein [soil metagenome]